MKVLIIHGSKMGGTEGIAHTIANRLIGLGFATTTRPASDFISPQDYDGVIIGGALYADRWHKAARKYVKRFAADLKETPVWLFSSGPLDDSALGNLPPTRQVSELMQLVQARDHITFGGRLEEDAPGFIAGAMAKTNAGDWRNESQIEAWADHIASALRVSDAA